jgi:hypothetical protein
MMRSERLPEVCAVAFKEWAGVCEALGSGRQTLILRKGGVEEGPRGFAPEHPVFWLYPTRVHEAEQGLKQAPTESEPVGPGILPIEALAVVEDVIRADSLETLLGLDDLHLWTEETVRKRYEYRRPGLWILSVRIYKRPTPWPLEVTPAQVGCKSWVPLESPIPTAGLSPVRTDQEASRDRAMILAALGVAS